MRSVKQKFIPQKDYMDCGPACLAMVAASYGKDIGVQYIRDKSYLTRDGVSLMGITEAAEEIGFKSFAAEVDTSAISDEFLPCILHWNQNHFVVLYQVYRRFTSRKIYFKIADPAHGIISLSEEKFKKSWIVGDDKGVALFLRPTTAFYEKTLPKEETLSIKHLINYLTPFKKQMFWMMLLLLLGTLTTFVFPVLTQRLIDDGVSKKNLTIISYILLAQLVFFLGNIIFGVLRNWIALIVGTKINIKIISDFLKRLLALPIRFFDTKLMGDFNQRIQDHERIENFLTSQSLLTLFSIVTFSVFFAFLWFYDFRILVVYVSLTAISVFWSLFWMRKRRILDYFRFQQRIENQQSIYEIVDGVSEMKLNQFEDYKRKEWEEIQQRLFDINVRILKFEQVQTSGFEFINQLKNILVTFLAATFVVQGHMSLGALLSVSYIIGQMNSPVFQLISFFRSAQDAKLSLLRLSEVQNHPVEEQEQLILLFENKFGNNGSIKKGIDIKNISFQYEGPQSPFVLKDIDILIPEGKVTAIVGASGSGKTTLLKILLKFYEPILGDIIFGDINLKDISPTSLRKNCGVVMQDGYIFSDSIERNIATGDEIINYEKLEKAIDIANLNEFIKELPLGLKTRVGSKGNGISGGQKQRILIARAVYKDPHYIFLDEATSSLDAENEKIIHDKLQAFFKSKTVIIIAHRLSTVKKADQILVMKQGTIVETGNHRELVESRNEYFDLVKNQLELGN
ncbi:ATP-binding cassette subfamily B protein [Mucilaginibacter frigoritolerans]|uniref:ATP-binding cassette subfamily B protein n=1 Tax=Mucilaginibacter frigoritolerans TaxID=652788 RepID=A0A562TNA5_9SPHI|nr:peptidase domain-containing ABC transporter [Mucilaginibacter frigoritolerans]TWI94576.1 ATP-binding cassette subfamily B protein [Mucilaginibacter frigoritolerans]